MQKKTNRVRKATAAAATAKKPSGTDQCTRIHTKLSQDENKAKADEKLGYIPNIVIRKSFELVEDLSGSSGDVTAIVKPRGAGVGSRYDLAVLKFFPFKNRKMFLANGKRISAPKKKQTFARIFKEIVLVCYLSKNPVSAPYCAEFYEYGNTPTSARRATSAGNDMFAQLNNYTKRRMLEHGKVSDVITHSSRLRVDDIYGFREEKSVRLRNSPGFFMTMEYMQDYKPMYDLDLYNMSDSERMNMLEKTIAGMVALSKALKDAAFIYHDLHAKNIMVNPRMLHYNVGGNAKGSNVPSPVKFIDFASIDYTNKSLPYNDTAEHLLMQDERDRDLYIVSGKTKHQEVEVRNRIARMYKTYFPIHQHVATADIVVKFVNNCFTRCQDTDTTSTLKIIALTVTLTVSDERLKNLLNDELLNAVIPRKRSGIADKPYEFLLKRVQNIQRQFI